MNDLLMREVVRKAITTSLDSIAVSYLDSVGQKFTATQVANHLLYVSHQMESNEATVILDQLIKDVTSA